MPAITVGKLKFAFPADWIVSKYDDWIHYRKQFIRVCNGIKAIDVIAIEPSKCCWLLEIKDYRQQQRTKSIDIAEEIAGKVRDTLAGLVAAQFCANDAVEKNIARAAVRAADLRVLFHLEQPRKHSKLFPRAIKPADVRQRLKQLIKAVDPHPQVVEMATSDHLLWKVSSVAVSNP